MLTKILLTLSLVTGISTIAVANSDKYDALQVNEIDSTSSKIVAQNSLPELENIAKAIAVKVYAGEDRGSGILIAGKNNTYTVITNAHVTDRGDTYTIETSDGIKHNAVISDRQATENDLAILEFDSNSTYQVAKLGDSKAISKDETVIAAGFPYDRDKLLITQGKISLLLDKPLAKGYQIGFSNETVQGMSGGLLLNAQGEVIGVLGKGKGALLEDSYDYQDGSSPTPESIEQMKDAGFSIPIVNIAEISPQLASLLPNTNNPKTAQNPQTETAQKPKYTGIVGKVDAIAEQITVRIDNTQNNTNGSGVIIAKQGNTYYGLTAKHVLCNGISKPNCEPNGTHEIVTPDGEIYKIDYQTVDANQEWLDIAIFSFKSDNDYAVATLGKYKPNKQLIFVSGFPNIGNSSNNEKPTRLITGGEIPTSEVGEELLAKDTASLSKSKGNDGLIYTNVSFRGMSGGAVLDIEGRLIGINTGSEQELYFDNEGNYSEFNLGLSLGEAVSDFFGYLEADTKAANKIDLKESWLNIAINPAQKLSKAVINDIKSQLLTVKQPQNNQDIATWMNYGNQLWRYGDNIEAIQAFEKVIEIDPNFDKAYYAMGLAYYNHEEYQQAIVSFTKAAKINPQVYYYWRYLAKAHDGFKQYEKALSAYDKAITRNQNEKNKDFILFLEKGNVLQQAGYYSRSLITYNKAAAINPNHPWIYTNRGVVYRKLKQYDRALSNYNQAIKINSQDEIAYLNRGNIYGDLKEYEQALANYNQAIKINPQGNIAYYNRGHIYVDLKQYKKALTNLNQAIKINPQLAEPYVSLGVIYSNLKQYEQAISNYNKAIKINSQLVKAYGNIANVYAEIKQYKKALSNYNQAIRINPQFTSAYLGRSVVYFELKHYDKALSDLNRVVKINPQNAKAYNNIGNVYRERKQYEQALDNYNQAIKINPQNANTYLNRGAVYHDLKQYQQALADYNQAIKINSQFAKAYFNIGNLYVVLDQYKKALINYNQAIKINPRLAESYVSRGVVYSNLKQYEQALADYNQAIEINPRLAIAYLNLGLNNFKFKRYNSALSNYTKAIEINPQDAATYNKIGLVYSKLKQYEQALSNYNQAIKINPQFGIAYRNSGLAYALLGDFEEAEKNIKKAVSLFNIQKKLQEYQKTLQILERIKAINNR